MYADNRSMFQSNYIEIRTVMHIKIYMCINSVNFDFLDVYEFFKLMFCFILPASIFGTSPMSMCKGLFYNNI